MLASKFASILRFRVFERRIKLGLFKNGKGTDRTNKWFDNLDNTRWRLKKDHPNPLKKIENHFLVSVVAAVAVNFALA